MLAQLLTKAPTLTDASRLLPPQHVPQGSPCPRGPGPAVAPGIALANQASSLHTYPAPWLRLLPGLLAQPASLSPQLFLESPTIVCSENASGGCHPASCPPVAHLGRLSIQGMLGKGSHFTCLLGGGDWLKLLESLLSELWGMAPVSGSQGLFSFLCTLEMPAFCLVSLPSPLPKMALGFPALARPGGTLSSWPVLCHFLCSPLRASAPSL